MLQFHGHVVLDNLQESPFQSKMVIEIRLDVKHLTKISLLIRLLRVKLQVLHNLLYMSLFFSILTFFQAKQLKGLPGSNLLEIMSLL